MISRCRYELAWLGLVLYAHFGYAGAVLDLSGESTPDGILFMRTDGPKALTLTGLRLYFLKGEDCYSGYMQDYRMSLKTDAVSLGQNQMVTLTGAGIYQSAAAVLQSEEIMQIQGVLLRFISDDFALPYQKLAHFTGSCQDQSINCCIPVTCSVNRGICTPKFAMSVQTMTWSAI